LAAVDPADESSWPPAALAMRQVLGQQLGVAPQSVALLAAEPVTWPDACLGAGRANELCLAALTLGHRLVFESNGGRYVVHTDAEALHYRLVEAPAPEIGETVVTWTQTGDDGACRQAEIGTTGVAFGPCFGVLLGGIYGQPARQADIQEFAAAYAPFTAETPAGDVQFRGSGTRPATPAEQRMVAEWARLVALEAEAGRSGASWGLVFSWHHEDGTEGVCADVTVYVTGDAYVATCAASLSQTLPQTLPQTLAHVRLDAAQLETVYGWLDTYAPAEWLGEQAGATETTPADRLVFSGGGTTVATPQLHAELAGFAAALWQAANPAQ
jgi:hypothetical protein